MWALVIHADHADLQPLVAGNLAQRRQPVHGGAMRAHRLPVLVFHNHFLPLVVSEASWACAEYAAA